VVAARTLEIVGLSKRSNEFAQDVGDRNVRWVIWGLKKT
jgi:hypothetical protein